MIETVGDLWTFPADIRVITTNGAINKNGELIMGRGVALQAKKKYPDIARELARLVTQWGNVPVTYFSVDGRIWTFPVKHHWSQDADLELIQNSATKLVHMVDLLQTVREHQGHIIPPVIVMPRPGCGNGHRDWQLEVKPILDGWLDQRFVVLTEQKELDT